MRVTSARELGALVKELRKQRALSQEDLAQRVGVSRQWIVGLEQGRARAFDLVMRTLASLDLAIEIVENERRPPSGNRIDLDVLLSALERRADG